MQFTTIIVSTVSVPIYDPNRCSLPNGQPILEELMEHCAQKVAKGETYMEGVL